jgi:hypothetical protein
MAEWLKASSWKGDVGGTLPGVRISLSPPLRLKSTVRTDRVPDRFRQVNHLDPVVYSAKHLGSLRSVQSTRSRLVDKGQRGLYIFMERWLEWFKAPVSKAGVGVSLPGVRISPFPPIHFMTWHSRKHGCTVATHGSLSPAPLELDEVFDHRGKASEQEA